MAVQRGEGGGWGEAGGAERLQRDTTKLLGVMGMLTILIVVMVLWVYTYVKSYQVVPFKCAVYCTYGLFLKKPEHKCV